MKETESFRLLTEYHSFLLKQEIAFLRGENEQFPSPYGVSFILILFWLILLKYEEVSFRLLMEYHSFL